MERDDRPPVGTFFTAEPLADGAEVTLGTDAAHHLRVRRLAAGARLSLLDGAGHRAVGTLVRLARDAATVEIERAERVEQALPVHAMVPVADRERMLWLAEKLVEIGLTSWRPVLWRRSRSVSPRGEGPGFQSKTRLRMIAALEQCGGAWLPDLFPDATLDRAIAAAPAGTRLLLDAGGPPLLSLPVAAPVTVAVGPEGGVEEDERERLVAAGFAPVSLSAHILRFETAGVAGVAIIRAALAAPPGRDHG